jgi:transcription elongation factor GreA
MGETTFLTRAGFERLTKELEYLRNVRRPEVADHIRIAKEDGDLSENAGYDAAKDEQAFVEGRILTLESILKNVQIIQNRQDSEFITLGSKVKVREDGYEPEVFQIVGSTEANPAEGRISNVSPLGQALLGRRVSENVEVSTPGGVSTFVILEIS